MSLDEKELAKMTERDLVEYGVALTGLIMALLGIPRPDIPQDALKRARGDELRNALYDLEVDIVRREGKHGEVD